MSAPRWAGPLPQAGRRLVAVLLRVLVRFAVPALVGGTILGASLPALGRPASPPAITDDPRVYRPPVSAPVTDPFRPPAQPWLAGNRGLEYATVPGTPVVAIGPGVVVFAGPVAGSLYVTVLHPDGLRSSYSWLAAVRVVVGDRVLGGQVVGIAGGVFHLGVRDGATYVDPAGLWGRRVVGGRVLLVPLDGGGAAGAPAGGGAGAGRSVGGGDGTGARSPRAGATGGPGSTPAAPEALAARMARALSAWSGSTGPPQPP